MSITAGGAGTTAMDSSSELNRIMRWLLLLLLRSSNSSTLIPALPLIPRIQKQPVRSLRQLSAKITTGLNTVLAV